MDASHSEWVTHVKQSQCQLSTPVCFFLRLFFPLALSVWHQVAGQWLVWHLDKRTEHRGAAGSPRGHGDRWDRGRGKHPQFQALG